MTVHGIPQAIAALEARKVAAKLASPLAARSGGQALALVQQAIAPKRTGQLASQITIELDGDTCHVGSTVDYDRFVQRGTRYMSAQPYGERAATIAAPSIALAMAAVYKTAIG